MQTERRCSYFFNWLTRWRVFKRVGSRTPTDPSTMLYSAERMFTIGCIFYKGQSALSFSHHDNFIIFSFASHNTFPGLQEIEHRSKRWTRRGTNLPVRMRSDSTTAIASDERVAHHTRSTDTRESGHPFSGENFRA